VVGVLVVTPMIGSPVEDWVLKCAGSKNQGSQTDRPLGLKRKVREKAVIAESDTQAGRNHIEGEHAPHDPVEVMQV